jgi:hypothetical protein
MACHGPDHGARLGAWGKAGKEKRRDCRGPGAGPARGWELVIPNPKLKLMDQVREVLRIKHYAIRTEQVYCDWVKRYVGFHQMRAREDLFPGAEKVELFLSDLAVNGQVAASTQNQAFNALLFLQPQAVHISYP